MDIFSRAAQATVGIGWAWCFLGSRWGHCSRWSTRCAWAG
jgi:hypothetical protein